MTDVPSRSTNAFRVAIERFLQGRLDAKLDKLAPDDPKRDVLIAQFHFETWIADAARRVAQIQIVTHTLKPIHPDARGTNLYQPPGTLSAHREVGSHHLGGAVAEDVVGNAAALDVYKLLKLEVQGRTLLHWMLDEDAALIEALSADADQAKEWMAAFAGIARPSGTVASHSLAKQLYWLSGDDPLADDQYHVLAPLFASSLAHAVYRSIDEDRFGADGKKARQARRDQQTHSRGFREYPDLAIQKLGGSNPQNISQLNRERRGNNYLLASLPPQWKSRAAHEPWHVDSVFPLLSRRNDMREVIHELRIFLLANPDPTMDTRNRRDTYLDALIDGLVGFAAQLQSALPAGWSSNSRCELVLSERLWLDPWRAQANNPNDEEFCLAWRAMKWPEEVGKRFGNWMNSLLDGKLPIGTIEQRYWARELLRDEEWAWTLAQVRHRVEAGVES